MKTIFQPIKMRFGLFVLHEIESRSDSLTETDTYDITTKHMENPMVSFLLATLLTFSNTAEANTIGVKLGSVQVADRTSKDVIRLPVCDGTNNIPVNSIQLKVRKKPVQIDKVKVEFYNGQQQLLTVKKHMKAGEDSRWLDLKGDARCIKKIINSKKQSTVAVAGKVKTKQLMEQNEVKPSNSNDGPKIHTLTRVKLGEQTERETKFLPSCKTDDNFRVSQIRIMVKNHPAEINKVRIQFQNGNDQFFHVNKHLAVGQMSPWVDLDGGSRCIKRVTFVGDADTIGYKPNARSTIVVQGR